MKKIRIGLTIPAIVKLVEKERDYTIAHTRLKQHKIIFSDVLLDEYEKSFIENDLIDEFRYWYAYYERFDGFFEFEESICEDFLEDIYSLLRAYDHSILIKDNEFVFSKDFSVLELDEINKSESVNELSMQCIPATFIMPKGYSKETFSKWLRDLFADEKSIKIVDKYIMSNTAKGILESVYLPIFPKDSTIYVYFGENEKSQVEISNLKNTYGNKIKLYSSVSSDFHERYIIGDSIIITIGVGLDVFNCEFCVSRKDTNISVSTQTTVPTLPRRFVERAKVYR